VSARAPEIERKRTKRETCYNTVVNREIEINCIHAQIRCTHTFVCKTREKEIESSRNEGLMMRTDILVIKL